MLKRYIVNVGGKSRVGWHALREVRRVWKISVMLHLSGSDQHGFARWSVHQKPLKIVVSETGSRSAALAGMESHSFIHGCLA